MEVLSLDWSPIDIPNVFREPHEPYLYQEQAAVLTVRQKALLLCDDVGLGKTISTFATAARGAPLPMAVIVDPNLMKQWERKAREFTHYRVHSVKKTSPYNIPDAALYIFSYTKQIGSASCRERSWQYVEISVGDLTFKKK